MKKQLLLDELRSKLNEIRIQNNGMIKIAGDSILVCREYLFRLNEEIKKNVFENNEAEIEFFKGIVIYPLSMLIYYTKVRNFETEYPSMDIEVQRGYIRNKIIKVNKFYKYNKDFIIYIKLKRTHLDSLYFTHKNRNMLNFSNTKHYFGCNNIFSSHNYLLAEYKGLQDYSEYLIQKLNELERNSRMEYKSGLNWTGKKTDLTELVYALYASKNINNGHIGIGQIARIFEQIFNIDLGDYSRTFISIRSRTKSRIKFLENMTSSLDEMMKELDR